MIEFQPVVRNSTRRKPHENAQDVVEYGGRPAVCHWVELEEGENTQADSSPPQWVAQTSWVSKSAAFSRGT
jgi:hypothetical protein